MALDVSVRIGVTRPQLTHTTSLASGRKGRTRHCLRVYVHHLIISNNATYHLKSKRKTYIIKDDLLIHHLHLGTDSVKGNYNYISRTQSGAKRCRKGKGDAHSS